MKEAIKFEEPTALVRAIFREIGHLLSPEVFGAAPQRLKVVRPRADKAMLAALEALRALKPIDEMGSFAEEAAHAAAMEIGDPLPHEGQEGSRSVESQRYRVLNRARRNLGLPYE